MADYFKERERDVNMRLREIRDTLPEFADEFFVGVEPQTTSLTRLGYAYDLRIFFDYLVKRVRPFRGMRAEDLTLANTCAAGGSAKGAAVQQWVLALWAQYYTVKDLLEAAETPEALRAVDISTDDLTPPPYTIRELNEEAASVLAQGVSE